jgi:hypothetical protein
VRSELKRGNQMKMKILPPTNASKLMQRSRSALQRAVMSRRLCSRCRMRRRSWWFVLRSGVASSPSVEESERMHSGTSSVPKISSGSKLLTVNSYIKVRLDLQADKSPVVVKGPFFPRVVNPRYRIHGTNV